MTNEEMLEKFSLQFLDHVQLCVSTGKPSYMLLGSPHDGGLVRIDIYREGDPNIKQKLNKAINNSLDAQADVTDMEAVKVYH